MLQKWADISPTLEFEELVDFTEYNDEIQTLKSVVKERLDRACTMVSGLLHSESIL